MRRPQRLRFQLSYAGKIWIIYALLYVTLFAIAGYLLS